MTVQALLVVMPKRIYVVFVMAMELLAMVVLMLPHAILMLPLPYLMIVAGLQLRDVNVVMVKVL